MIVGRPASRPIYNSFNGQYTSHLSATPFKMKLLLRATHCCVLTRLALAATRMPFQVIETFLLRYLFGMNSKMKLFMQTIAIRIMSMWMRRLLGIHMGPSVCGWWPNLRVCQSMEPDARRIFSFLRLAAGRIFGGRRRRHSAGRIAHRMNTVVYA